MEIMEIRRSVVDIRQMFYLEMVLWAAGVEQVVVVAVPHMVVLVDVRAVVGQEVRSHVGMFHYAS
jgi:hypothetical protein